MAERTPAPTVGLIPAAGFATRLGRQVASKEALPLAGRPLIHHLLERFAVAGIESSILVLRPGKNDVLAALQGAADGVSVETVWTDPTPGVPYTLDVAHDRLLGKRVALGFPDILFEPRDAYLALDRRQQVSGADLVLGLFPTDAPGLTDMVELDERGRPVDIVIKDQDCQLRYTWQVALWTETVTRFLHQTLTEERADQTELYVGDVLRRALDQGIHAEAVIFEQGRCLDVGVPEALELARELEGDLTRSV